MSASSTHSVPALEGAGPTPNPDAASPASGHQLTGTSGLVRSVVDSLAWSGKWSTWRQIEPRLDGFDSLGEACEAWRRHDRRCYDVVAGLVTVGSRRGGDDDDAALAVVALLEDGVRRAAASLRDVCEVDEVRTAVWEEVKAAEPGMGAHAARYVLRRAHHRLARPAGKMASRMESTSLEQRTHRREAGTVLGGGTAREDLDRNLLLAVPEVENPVEDLAELLIWARRTGVIAKSEVELIVELLAAESDGTGCEEAQRLVGQRHGVTMRTIRRRRDATTARLRAAAGEYLAATG